jgi:hypothetical protein
LAVKLVSKSQHIRGINRVCCSLKFSDGSILELVPKNVYDEVSVGEWYTLSMTEDKAPDVQERVIAALPTSQDVPVNPNGPFPHGNL